MYGDRAVITRPGADERKPETAGTAAGRCAGLGYDVVEIEAPGTLDGGDVLKHGGTVWVGLGGRTNRPASTSWRRTSSRTARTVVGVPVHKVLHLKSAVTALPDGTVIGFPPLVDDPARVAVVPRRCRGVRLARRPARRRPVLMSDQRPAEPGALRGARAARGRRRHHRVREARGLRDLPVGAAAPHALTPDGSVGEGAELVALGVGQHGPAESAVALGSEHRGAVGDEGVEVVGGDIEVDAVLDGLGLGYAHAVEGVPRAARASARARSSPSPRRRPAYRADAPPPTSAAMRAARPRSPRGSVPDRARRHASRWARVARRRRAPGPRGRRGSSSAPCS